MNSSIDTTDTPLSESDRRGSLYNDGGIAVIDLHGSWHEMGRQYGILARDRMNDVLSYLDGKIGSDKEKTDAACDIAGKLYSNYPSHLKEFFSGITETSGLSLDRVKLCNAVEYVEGVFLCSAMAAWGDYTEGRLIFGRNYDAASYSEIDRDIVVTVYHPDDAMAAATIGYAGEIYCVNGFNEKGIFIELNNGMPSAGFDIHWDLCPSTTALFEMLFSADTIEKVDEFFNKTRSFASFTIGVADKREARSYEWCHQGVRRGDEMTDDGLMISTNHYVHRSWGFTVPSDKDSWDSISRRCNLEKRAREYRGRFDVSTMKKVMSAPIEEGGPKHLPTRYQIVAVPEDMTLHINIPYNNGWTEINLRNYFSKE